MRIFLDANVLFSAAKTDGAVRKLLRLLHEARHQCRVDQYVVGEARRNLIIKGPEVLAAFDTLVASCRMSPVQAIARNTPRAAIAWLPEKDRPVMAAAILARCDVLLTGDRTHFGTGYGKVFADVAIHSPRSLAETLFP